MKKLEVLKKLISVAFFFDVFAVVIMIIFIPLTWGNSEINLTMNGQKMLESEWPEKTVLILGLISALFFIYSIYLLRKVVALFAKRDLFNERVVRYFNTIGICLIVSSVLTCISIFFYDMFRNQEAEISLNSSSFDTLLLSVTLGLFFMVLSEVFKTAKNIKEENELTV